MTRSTASHFTAVLTRLVAQMPRHIEIIDKSLRDTRDAMNRLRKSGLIYATEHWRRGSDGRPKYLYLLYSTKSDVGRRRDYVGTDATKIAAARAGIDRANQHDALQTRLRDLEGRIYITADLLQQARRQLAEIQ